VKKYCIILSQPQVPEIGMAGGDALQDFTCPSIPTGAGKMKNKCGIHSLEPLELIVKCFKTKYGCKVGVM
jgi:hypothetical protein